jgi:hypothetical protein
VRADAGPIDREDELAETAGLIARAREGDGGVLLFQRPAGIGDLHEKTANGSLGQPAGPAGELCLGNTVGHIAFNGACHAGVKGFSWGAL